MVDAPQNPTWQNIERLLDELLDLPSDKREQRLKELDEKAPDYALAARKALSAASDDGLLETGLEGVAGNLLRDLLDKESTSEIGSELSVYRLEEVIGRGGMGVVYRASRIDGQFDQTVAIKKIPFGLAGERGVSRFQEERTILASVQHPFIGQLLDGGVDGDGLPYLIMEFIDGGVTIDRYISEHKLPEKQILSLFKAVCNAVSFLHRNLITHGDIKPNNILVRPDGHPKLIDFGISKLATATDDVKPIRLHGATPGFASPEQLRGEPITTQSDIYALGATLETILANRSASSGEAHTDLLAIIQKCQRDRPEGRYATVEGLTRDLNQYLTTRPVQAREGGIRYRAGKYIRRNLLSVLAAFAVTSSFVGGFAYSSHQAMLAKQEASRSATISEFLISIFEQSADAYSSDGDPTLYDLVEAADVRISTELKETPAIKADLQEIFGQAYDGLLQDTGKAKSHFEDVLAYDREFDPENTDRILSMLGWIAKMHRKEGDYEGGNKIIDEAIEIDMLDGRPDMVGWMTKAEIAHQIGPVEDELRALNMAEQVYARDYGADSNEMAAVLAARALTTAAHLSDRQGSAEFLNQAIAMRERNGGGKWVSTERMRANLALELQNLGRYDEALEINEQVILSIENRLGPDHHELVSKLNNIGALYNDMGDIVTGEKHLVRGVAIARATMEENNFQRLATELNYARTLIWARRPDEAMAILPHLESNAIEAVGANHPLTGVIQRDMAWALLDQGDLAAARTFIDLSKPKLKISIRRAIANKIDAEITVLEGDLNDAEDLAKQSLSEFEEANVSRSWMITEARLLKASIQFRAGKDIDLTNQAKDKKALQETLPNSHRARRLAD